MNRFYAPSRGGSSVGFCRRSYFQLPRRPVGTRKHGVGVVAVELVGLRVPADFLAQPHRDAADMTDDHRPRPDLDVADRLLAALHALEEVLHVPAGNLQPWRVLWKRFLDELFVTRRDAS